MLPIERCGRIYAVLESVAIILRKGEAGLCYKPDIL
jgi:hypothetical protein